MKKQFFLWALNKYKAYKQSKNDSSQEHALKTVKILLDKAKYGFYISQGNDGWASTRYVQPKRIELMDFKRNIIPEPFGLKPLVLEQGDGQWIVT